MNKYIYTDIKNEKERSDILNAAKNSGADADGDILIYNDEKYYVYCLKNVVFRCDKIGPIENIMNIIVLIEYYLLLIGFPVFVAICIFDISNILQYKLYNYPNIIVYILYLIIVYLAIKCTSRCLVKTGVFSSYIFPNTYYLKKAYVSATIAGIGAYGIKIGAIITAVIIIYNIISTGFGFQVSRNTFIGFTIIALSYSIAYFGLSLCPSDITLYSNNNTSYRGIDLENYIKTIND